VVIGRTLIIVPCWWDTTVNSLVVTIREKRPDLLQSYFNIVADPIKAEPPAGYFSVVDIPDVGFLMQACFLRKYDAITNWWMGEKYDGIRAFWNPKRNNVYSRQGNVIQVRNDFENVIPVLFLDGEFWFGRRKFIQAARLIHCKTDRSETEIKWPFARYAVFDCPSPQLPDMKFEARYTKLLSIKKDHAHMLPCTRLRCKSRSHMKNYLNNVIHNKGEGIMLRKPNTVYDRGRSYSLFKAKNMTDAEAVVVGIQENKYICKLPNGDKIYAFKNFKLNIKFGDVVSFANVATNKLQTKYMHKITHV